MANPLDLKPVLPPTERLQHLEKTATDFEIYFSVPIRRYFKSGAEMLRLANNYCEDQNPEKAYLLYHKYLTLFIEKVTRHSEYPSVSAQERVKVMQNLKMVMTKCEDIKVVLRVSFKEDYEEYLSKVEVLRQEEEERQQKEDEARIQEEHRRHQENAEAYHREKEKNLAIARDRELAIWHQAVIDRELEMEQQTNEGNDDDDALSPVAAIETSSFPPTVPDRSTKPHYLSFMHDHEIGSEGSSSGLKTLIVPSCLMPTFLSVAEPNTSSNVETCGILAGKLIKNRFHVTHLIIPKQNGTSDSCTTKGEEELIACQDQFDLITLGWIHTHPTQTAFLSSVDLHTQCSYQLMLPEAIAIVCSPSYEETGFFVLTPNYGLDYISHCHRTGFHPHPKEPPLFEKGKHIEIDHSATVEMIDLRFSDV